MSAIGNITHFNLNILLAEAGIAIGKIFAGLISLFVSIVVSVFFGCRFFPFLKKMSQSQAGGSYCFLRYFFLI